MLTQKPLETNAGKTIDTLFDLIGLDFAREGNKAKPFEKNYLGLCHKGVVAISQEPLHELSSLVSEFLDSGVITAKQAESLTGRVRWFESFAFGRVANQAIAQLGEFSRKEDLPLKVRKSYSVF